jgi:polyisoprenoid-binding protein YceI
MSFGRVMRNKKTWFIGIPVLLVVIFVGGPFVYINFIKDDAPPPLKLSTVSTTKPDPATSSTAPSAASVDGSWTVKSGTVGYRVTEVLFGQTADAAGRTNAVTGDLTMNGTTAETASFTADLTTLKSDQANRDNQVQGRIMNTAEFPNATFKLTSPITLASIPADLVEVKAKATGDLTLRGVTKSVTFDLTARRNGDTIEVNGSIPITWSDYNIPAPSGGPAQVEDAGQMEFLITFSRS